MRLSNLSSSKETTVTTSVTPGDASEPPGHPLGMALARTLARDANARVLVLGYGSGRSLPALLACGARIDVIEPDASRARDAMLAHAAEPRVRIVRGALTGPYDAVAGGFAAALSTHALLHGSSSEVARAIGSVANRLAPAGVLHATFGSVRDPRYASGRPIEPFVSAPTSGREAGVPHVYFTESRVRELLAAFELDELSEGSAAQSVGAWAHDETERQTMLHWFVRAHKR